ncbi:MAG: NAD(P)H-dependent oxidoreductase [Bacteroidales bacterium]
MNYLIIFTHPNGKGFSHKILQTVIDTIGTNDNNYQLRNLNEIGFNPVLSNSDLAMFKRNEYPDDIKQEQELIRWADVLIFVYPLWWGGMPAILKGYIDRVFASGFAYEYNSNNPVGLLKGKKAMLFSTQGYSREHYESIGMNEAMMKVERDGIFKFCGIEMTDHLFFGNASSLSKEQELSYLVEVKDLLEGRREGK